MSNSGLMTIDRFNKLTGHETLHPLICMVDLSRTNLNEDIRMMCDFYGLLYYNDPEQDKISGKEWLRLIYPGETVEIPLNRHRHTGCCCKATLSEHERNIITDNLREIGEELHHAIDRHSASIIASHIELLLNYCIRFCNQ